MIGTFSVSTRSGFVPSPGDTFDVLSYPSATHEFTCFSGLDLGGGALLLPQFTATSLSLTATTYATNSAQGRARDMASWFPRLGPAIHYQSHVNKLVVRAPSVR